MSRRISNKENRGFRGSNLAAIAALLRSPRMSNGEVNLADGPFSSDTCFLVAVLTLITKKAALRDRTHCPSTFCGSNYACPPPCPLKLRDCKEISWTLWGLSVPQIWLRRLSESAGVAVSTSRNSRLRSSQRWGAIGHPKVQVIFLQSLKQPKKRRSLSLRICPRP